MMLVSFDGGEVGAEEGQEHFGEFGVGQDFGGATAQAANAIEEVGVGEVVDGRLVGWEVWRGMCAQEQVYGGG